VVKANRMTLWSDVSMAWSNGVSSSSREDMPAMEIRREMRRLGEQGDAWNRGITLVARPWRLQPPHQPNVAQDSQTRKWHQHNFFLQAEVCRY
jgi:hypothetical protein